MLVPGHVCSFYLATGGANGPALGSDEKEIVMLEYNVIDVLTNEIIFSEQFLVRPNGRVGGRENNNKKDKSTTSETVSPTASLTDIPIVPEFTFTEAVLKSVGIPLNEVIKKFDQKIRSLNIDPDSPTFRIVTDGQLPLRQCLHPEACAKDIELPNYYCKFSDLRKEFLRYKSAGLSRAFVAAKDGKTLPNMPPLSSRPASIAEMIAELQIETSTQDQPDFYLKECQDMVTIIQTMLSAGHKFETSEIINLSLEPGICSIDDEIDGLCIVRARGLPWQSSDQDIAKFFRGLNVAKGGVALCLSPQGRRNGEALVRFVSQEHRDMALKRHKHHISNRYIEVYRASGEDFLNVAGGASNEAQAFLSKGAEVIIRMRGLPYLCTAKQVLDFFSTGNEPCQVLDGADGILFVKRPDGRATGDAFVLFSSEADAPKALARHRESIGNRYIELFRSTTAEVQQVLNRSMDPKTYLAPLIAQLPPPVQYNLLPQHVITSGTAKNCIRLRGLPYTIEVQHILHFLEDFANNIIYQGVHMVYNAQGQPSGEAFIQMDSEEAAHASALQKHNKYMMFGKKPRYIEVFQCSGDDMNLVLNGGIHSPANPTKSPLLSPGMLTQAQQSNQSLPSPGLPINVPPPITLSLPQNPPQNTNALLAQQQAQYIAQQNLIARQQAAAAAAAVANHNAQTQSNEQSQYLLSNYALSLPNLVQSVPPQTPTSAQTVAAASSVAQPNAGQHPFFFMQRPTLHPNHASQFSPQLGQMIPMGAGNMLAMTSNMLAMTGNMFVNSSSLMPPHHLAALQPKTHAAAAMHHHHHHNAGFGKNHAAHEFQMRDNALSHQHQQLMNVPLAAASTLMHAASIKRSYESAFQPDAASSSAVSANASKRFFTRHPANLYSPFYPPNL